MNKIFKINLVLLTLSLSCLAMQDVRFRVFDGQKIHEVKQYDIDPQLRNLKVGQLKAFLDSGCKLKASRLSNGDYVIRQFVPGKGGGLLGASIGAFIGKAAVSIVGHGAIVVASACTGPAFWVTMTALESTCGPAIEAASIKGAVIGGLAGAAATGPV